MQVRWHFSYSEQDIKKFVDLSGDDSPIHTSQRFCQDLGFKSPLLHGALLTTQLSRLIGKELPDNKAMTVGFGVDFLSPAYSGENLEFSAIISYKSDATKIIEFKYLISREGTAICKGKITAQWREAKHLCRA